MAPGVADLSPDLVLALGVMLGATLASVLWALAFLATRPPRA